MSDRIYRTCGREAAMSPICSFEQGFDISGVHCLPVPIQSSATGYLAWEGWMYGTYRPYYFDASQPLAAPEWYSDTGIDFNAPQWEDRHWSYGHHLFPYGLYHFGSIPEYGSRNPQSIPQPARTRYVPCDYQEAIIPVGEIMGHTESLSHPSIRGHSMPEEAKDSDSSNSTDTKVDKKTESFSGCHTTGGTLETESVNKMDSISSSVTDSVRTNEAHEHSDGNRNQAILSAQCTTLGYSFTYMCSEKTAEALAASWKSQVVSESILEATGNPVAQFERLLYATAPVVSSSSNRPPDEILCRTSTPRSTILSKCWWPDVSLLDVWKWYIECAGFDLGVKVEDSWKSDYFTAYFTPSLSAVQLFGYSHSSLSDSLKKLSVGVP
uniref:Uncharacterized protein n=1 Tax=Arundo donax TaxID=35708 RepID=A0A0A9CUW3_ARUDO